MALHRLCTPDPSQAECPIETIRSQFLPRGSDPGVFVLCSGAVLNLRWILFEPVVELWFAVASRVGTGKVQEL